MPKYICKHCGSELVDEGGTLSCPNCGGSFRKPETAAESSSPAGSISRDPQKMCPRCGAMIPESADVCPSCGAAFKGGKVVRKRAGGGSPKKKGMIVGIVLGSVAVTIGAVVGIVQLISYLSNQADASHSYHGSVYSYYSYAPTYSYSTQTYSSNKASSTPTTDGFLPVGAKKLTFDRDLLFSRVSITNEAMAISSIADAEISATGAEYYLPFTITDKTGKKVVGIRGTVHYDASTIPASTSASNWYTNTLMDLPFVLTGSNLDWMYHHIENAEPSSDDYGFVSNLFYYEGQNKNYYNSSLNKYYRIECWLENYTVLWGDGTYMESTSLEDGILIAQNKYGTPFVPW